MRCFLLAVRLLAFEGRGANESRFAGGRKGKKKKTMTRITTKIMFLAIPVFLLAVLAVGTLVLSAQQARADTQTNGDFTLTKRFIDEEGGRVGRPVKFVIRETNNSSNVVQVRVFDHYPKGFHPLSITRNQDASCQTFQADHLISCTTTLSAGRTFEMTIGLTPSAPGHYVNFARDSVFGETKNSVQEPFTIKPPAKHKKQQHKKKHRRH